jgi:hypothetical protein
MDNYRVEYYQNKPSRNTEKSKGSCNRNPNKPMFCDDAEPIGANNPNYVSRNQRLAGPANKKTLIPPVVVPPLADIDYWRANNLINNSHINTESQFDTYLSGYQVSNCCDNIDMCIGPSKSPDKNTELGTIIEGFEDSTYVGIPTTERARRVAAISKNTNCIQSPTPVTIDRFSAVREKRGISEGYEGYSSPLSKDVQPIHLQHVAQIKSPVPTTMYQENFEIPYIRENQSGWVNTTCGYNPDQVQKSNLPSNLASGNCEKSEDMKEYNRNLFTQNLQPDIYTRNQVIEPINSNMGISFTQQFEPTTSSREDNGLTYTEHDPRIYKPKMVSKKLDMSVTESDIYDPRFSGYGTSYRAYTDENVGQTRFYYDDVNAIRMPNYIVRSNIDHTNYADSYGPLHDDNKKGNKYNSNIRALAQDTFLAASLQQRNDLSERLMRKRNAELWQLRKYPMRTFGGKK